jgi:hypothetical protein
VSEWDGGMERKEGIRPGDRGTNRCSFVTARRAYNKRKEEKRERSNALTCIFPRPVFPFLFMRKKRCGLTSAAGDGKKKR